MEKKKVWRVQNEFCSGPYNGLGNLLEVFKAFERSGRMKHGHTRPAPWQDEELKHIFNNNAGLNPEVLCAYRTIDQYEKWFNSVESRELLHVAGYFLAQYSVEGDVWHGKTQSPFVPKNTKLIAVRPCNDTGITKPEDSNIIAARRMLKSGRTLG